MEIFNIHLFEFLLIAGLALIVFGPERLPELGRFVGKQVAKFLAWQQQSPELRLINEVRADIEQEIASLRDELVRTRNQLDLSTDVAQIREELRPLISLREPPALNPDAAKLASPDTQQVLAETLATEAQAVSVEHLTTEAQATVAETLVTQVQTSVAANLTSEAQDTLATQLQPVVTNSELLAPAAAAALPSPGPAGTIPAQRPERPVAGIASGVLNPIDDADAYLSERRALGNGVPLDQTHTIAPPSLNGHTPADVPLSAAERDELVRQVQILSAELQSLISVLRQRGIMVEAEMSPTDPPEQESIAR